MVGPLGRGSEEPRAMGWVGDMGQVESFVYLKS